MNFHFHTKTHLLVSSPYYNSLSGDKEKLHKEIFRLSDKGLGYRRIHRKLVEKGFQIGKSPTTVDSMIKKMKKRDEFFSQPILDGIGNFRVKMLEIN